MERKHKLPIGWISYIRSPVAMAALQDDPRVSSYLDGILIKIRDTPLIFKDSQAREKALSTAIEIRKMLRAAGATDWMEGAEFSSPIYPANS